jgi:hypothetical protein
VQSSSSQSHRGTEPKGRTHLILARATVVNGAIVFFLSFAVWLRGSLQRHEHQHQPAAALERRHRLAKDRALRSGGIRHFHRMARPC